MGLQKLFAIMANFVSLLLVCIVFAGPATSAESVGSAKRIIKDVTGDGAVGSRSVVTSDPVYRNERVAAGIGSRGELELSDGSRLIVGENSVIDLDEFVIASTGFQSATINVAKGAFRFISGNSAKGAISIKTPLSTIGIRGTKLDVYVGEGGMTRVVLLSGQAITCTRSGRCITLNRSCDIVEVRSRNDIEKLPFLRSAARSRNEESGLFSLTENQGRHTDRWRASTAGCSARSAADTQREGDGPDRGVDGPDVSEPPSPSDDSEGEGEGEGEGEAEGDGDGD